MAKPPSVDLNRFDTYKGFRFLVYFGQSESPVAAVSQVAGIPPDILDCRERGNAVIRKGLGRTKYEPITLERGVTHDAGFEEWANAARKPGKEAAGELLKILRRDIRIERLNEAGQPVIRYLIHQAWVSEFRGAFGPDARGNTVAWEYVKLEHGGWECDFTGTEPEEM